MRPSLCLQSIPHQIWEVAKWCVAWQYFALLWSSQARSTAEAEWIQRWVGCLSWCDIVRLKHICDFSRKKRLKNEVCKWQIDRMIDQGPGWCRNWSEPRTDPCFDFRLSETLLSNLRQVFQEWCFGRTQVDFYWEGMNERHVFVFAVATPKKVSNTMSMLPSSWNFVGVPASLTAFSAVRFLQIFRLWVLHLQFEFQRRSFAASPSSSCSSYLQRLFCWIWQKDHKNMELPTFIVKSEILTFCEAGCIGGFCERYCFEVVWGACSVAQLRKFFGFWDIQFVPRHFLGHWTSYPTSMLCYTSHLQHQTLQPKRWSWYLQAFSVYWTRTSYPRSWEGRL